MMSNIDRPAKRKLLQEKPLPACDIPELSKIWTKKKLTTDRTNENLVPIIGRQSQHIMNVCGSRRHNKELSRLCCVAWQGRGWMVVVVGVGLVRLRFLHPFCSCATDQRRSFAYRQRIFFFRCYWLPSLYSFAQRERSLTNQWVVKRLFKANEFVENTINRQWTESDRMCAWFWGCSWYECDGVLTRERSIQNRRLFSSALDGFGHHQEVIRFWTNASNGSVRIRTFDIPHLLRILNVPRLWMISFPS